MGYASINNLYRDKSILMFKKTFALEKIHGTSSGIHLTKAGEIHYFSGGAKHEEFLKIFDHAAIEAFFRGLELEPGVGASIYGEAYGGKMQGMSKTYGPTLKFIGFDVRIGDRWLSVPQAHEFVEKAGLEFVPYEFVETTEEALNYERDRDSIVAIRRGMGPGHIREGVVLRPPVEVTLNNGERICAKHKRDEFREHATPRKIENVEEQRILEEASAVADEWCVMNRLHHVIQHLTVDGVEPPMERMRDIIREMTQDIYREAAGEIVPSKEVEKAIGKRTVQLFKKYLNEKQVDFL